MLIRNLVSLTACAVLAFGGTARAEFGDWQGQAARAAQTLGQATTGAARLRALTDLIAAQEAGQSDLRNRLRELSVTEASTRVALLSQDDTIAGILIALQRLSPSDAPLPLIHPSGITAAARAAGVTETLVAALAKERQALAENLTQIQAAQTAIAQADAQLTALQAETAAYRQTLIDAAAAGGPLPPAFDSETAAARALAIGVDDIDGLTRDLPKPPKGAQKTPVGDLPMPVAEAVAHPMDKGWAVSAIPGALVTAPAAASVLYAGPLRGYRIVVLLELGPGQLLVLAGLAQAVVSTKAEVAAGAALGFLPDLADIEAATEGEGSQRIVTRDLFPASGLAPDTLYIEARDADRPVDPGTWFAVTKDQ